MTHKHPLDDFPEKNVLFEETWHGVEIVYIKKVRVMLIQNLTGKKF